MVAFVKGAWKAVVAAVSPLVVAALAEVLSELSMQGQAIWTAAVTAVVVYLVPNKP